MKKLVLFLSLLIIIQAETFSQSCLPDGINFNTQAEIDNFQSNYPNCSEIEGNVRICGVDIIDLSGLSVLESIEGNLMIGYWENIGNYDLTSLSGLENLNSVGGTLSIKYNDALLDLSGLIGLNHIGGSLSMVRVPLITNFSGLNNLTSIGGYLYLVENYSLETFIGLDNLTSIDGDITIDGNNALMSIGGIENLSASSINSLTIYGNSSLTNCNVETICNYLSSPNGVVKIRNNDIGCNSPPEVAEGCGITLPCLPFGDYVFTSQSQIDSFQTDYPLCTELQGNSLISGDDITNLTGLNIVTTFGKNLKIIINPLLSDLSSLENLVYVGEDLTIYDNSSLLNTSALEKLEFIGHDFYIGYNDALVNITSLDSLVTIGRDLFVVHNNSLNNITGLTKLDTIGRFLLINGNLVLNNIIGLENIDASTISGLEIHDNNSLSECAIKSICEYLEINTVALGIYNNTNGCNSDDEVLEVCMVGNPFSFKKDNSVIVYPNPARNEITLRNTSNNFVNKVVILNMHGQQVKEIYHLQNKIDISNLEKGMYIIEITIENIVIQKKLIII